MTLATAIAATSAYTAFAVLLTTRQSHALLQTVIEETVRTNISTVANELVGTIRDQNSMYLPVASYPATNSPDPAFNRDLNRSFISSNNYIFQGVTARYNIARLASSDTRFDLVRIIVADPLKPDSVVTRAKHVEHDVEGGLSGAHLAHVRAGMIDDIWMSIVGAHRCWRKSDRIEFCFLADPPIDRAEIFDTEMFLTRYSEPKSWGFEFPETDRFLQGSMPYQMHAKDWRGCLPQNIQRCSRYQERMTRSHSCGPCGRQAWISMMLSIIASKVNSGISCATYQSR